MPRRLSRCASVGVAAIVALALVDAVAGTDAALGRRQPDLGRVQPLGGACGAVGLVSRRAGFDAAFRAVGPGLGFLVARLLCFEQRLGLRQCLLGRDPAFTRSAAGRVGLAIGGFSGAGCSFLPSLLCRRRWG